MTRPSSQGSRGGGRRGDRQAAPAGQRSKSAGTRDGIDRRPSLATGSAGGRRDSGVRKPGVRPGTSANRLPRGHVFAARRKGEWLEVTLPDHLAGAGLGGVGPHIPVPPKLLRELSAHNSVTVQGKQLRLRLFPRESVGMPNDWMDLNILYEDDYTLVVNKPVGVEIHPSVKGQRGTLANGVAAYYEATDQPVRVRPMHRLDKETTGPVLFAKNDFAQAVYERAIRGKEVDREYIAIAEGVMQTNKGKIDLPIGQDRHHSTRRRVSDTGESALTHFTVVERYTDHTLVRLKLETGRTHQIRVHLSAIGHPLAGDGMYGGSRRYIHRQALHGEQLSWAHPWTGDRQSVKAPLPDDMLQAIGKLKGTRS